MPISRREIRKSKSSMSRGGGLDELAKQVGGTVRGDKVEYQVSGTKGGRRFKATRYMRAGETQNLEAPVASDVYAEDKGVDRGEIDPQTLQQPSAPQVPSAPQAPAGSISPTQQLESDIGKATTAMNTLKSKYQGGLQKDISTGTETGQDVQSGLGSVSKFVESASAESPSVLGSLMEVDTNFDSIFTDYDALKAPETQRKSLVDEYKKLSSSLGIEDINEELIDAQKIIDGTEDDIRNEVTAAGGFATDSQVLSMANARNKSLIKNYNALLATRDNAMQQLNTMMQLSVQDRQFAEAEFDRKLNFAFKVQEFKEKALDNAREGYDNVIKALGYDGFYNSLLNDPTSLSRAEKVLGLSSGQLQKAAVFAGQERAKVEEERQLDLENKRLTNQKLRLDIAGEDGKSQTVIPQVPISELQSRLSGLLSNDKVPAAMRDQVRKGLVLINKAQSMVERNPDKNFAGGRGTAVKSFFWPSALEPRFQALKADESKLRQDFVTYITGAAYTSLQEDDVNKIIPRSQLYDSQNVQRTNNLVNTVLGDIEAALQSSGIDAQLPQYTDLWEMNELSSMVEQLSPEQKAELQALGLM